MRSLSLMLASALALAAAGRPRLIVLTDIGGDPDDQQSMIRLMTYANEFDIEGLIASASGIPGELKEHKVQPGLIRDIVRAYGEVQPNLAKHAAGYPTAIQLLSVVNAGNPMRGMEKGVGDGHDSEGSNWIITVVDRPDPRPVNIAVWGGPTELAQALHKVRATRTPAEVDRFLSKLRVHSTGFQDDTGPWITENFPKLFYILSAADPTDVSGRPQRPGSDRRNSTYRGMYLGGDMALTSKEWIETNVKNGHGPLGALYPMKTYTAPNPHTTLKEGDTPTFFYFLSLGWNDPEHPEWGGWGGRFQRLRDNLFNDAKDSVDGSAADARAAVWRWRPEFQADFAARMDWASTPDRTKANHPPQAILNRDRTASILRIEAKPGATVPLTAAGSGDPDRGQTLTYSWTLYPEAGTCPVDAGSFDDPSKAATRLRLSPIARNCELHVLLKVQDSGSPSLTAGRRAIIRIR